MRIRHWQPGSERTRLVSARSKPSYDSNRLAICVATFPTPAAKGGPASGERLWGRELLAVPFSRPYGDALPFLGFSLRGRISALALAFSAGPEAAVGRWPSRVPCPPATATRGRPPRQRGTLRSGHMRGRGRRSGVSPRFLRQPLCLPGGELPEQLAALARCVGARAVINRNAGI